MILRFIFVLILLGAMFGGIFAWKQQQMQQQQAMMSQPPPPAVVTVATVTTVDWAPALTAIGDVTAIAGVIVANEIEGLITKIAFKSGERVRSGALLVQLDDSVDQAELAGLVAARRLTEVRFQRAEKLLAQKSTSQSDYDQAEAELQEAEAAVVAKRAEIAKKAIKVPFDGVLGMRQVDLGAYLAKGTPIVSLQRLDPIYVDFTLPERELAALHVEQTIRVRVQAYPETLYTGQIQAIDPRIDSGTRSIQVRAVVANPEHRLRPGMFAEVEVALPVRERVLTLPRTAVTYAPYGDSVFIVLADEAGGGLIVQRRQIQTGVVRAGRVEIVAGLNEGDQVVQAGQNKLRNGQAVRIDNQIELDPDSEVGPA